VVITLLMLTFLAMPIFQSEVISASWYNVIYTVLIFTTASITGLLIALVIMLYSTIRDIIRILVPDIDD
jgi:ABC-type transport system involved in multi-copper enzyme maturation permease subunit